MQNDTFPLVSICMITYNHESYIKQALNSVLMQKCDFLYEIIIGEDCSKDETLKICQEFSNRHPQIKLLPTSTNLGMIPNFVRTLKACKGKYIAILEGDDYWCDPLKLKKQVDFLEANAEYGLVHTAYTNFIQSLNLHKENINNEIYEGSIFEKLLIENKIATLTVMARRNLILDAIDSGIFEQGFILGDYPLWLSISLKTKTGFINEKTAIYRVLEESASHSKDINREINIHRSVINIKRYFALKYNFREILYSQNLLFYQDLLSLGFNHQRKDFASEAYISLKEFNGYKIKGKDRLLYFGSLYFVPRVLVFLLRKIQKATKIVKT